VIDKKTLIFSV